MADPARLASPPTQVRAVPRGDGREIYLSRPGAAPAELPPLVRCLRESWQAEAVSAELFTAVHTEQPPQGAPTPADLPLTWVQEAGAAPGLGGIHLRGVAGLPVQTVRLRGRPVGTLVRGPHALECTLSGLLPPDLTAPPAVQARATFEALEEALAQAEMDFSHVVRTWLFLDDILSWYGDFNRVRTAFFTERGVFDRFVPASTGIGTGNPLGAALVAGAYAVRPLTAGVTVTALPSPLQCPALEYGSSFSRAAEVVLPHLRRVLVSGTASIAPGGETTHVGDLAAQVARTCEVVAAILQSRELGWGEVTRATAYVRGPEGAEAFERYRQGTELAELPVVVAQAVICRGDLLFELEVDAVQAR